MTYRISEPDATQGKYRIASLRDDREGEHCQPSWVWAEKNEKLATTAFRGPSSVVPL